MFGVRVFVTMCTIVVGAVVVAPAFADNGPPKDAATSVYVEQIPTASGSVAAGAKGKKTKLPASVQTKLKKSGGTDAKALETLATQSGLGAPTTAATPTPTVKPKAKPQVKPKPKPKPVAKPAQPTTTAGSSARQTDARSASAPTSGGSGGSSRLIVLLAVLALVGLASIGFAVRMRGRHVADR
ncbi:MAG: hypothetical protein QOH95_2833 [Gaiellaceae bacterium]|jgi:cobalamin biosynthesis Mg chelatase CobN|nr:hypothetical protein [Gaiellaceae bacterium]